MEHGPPPAIPEDYKAWAKISSGEREFLVPCKVFLPKTVMEWPQVYIFPDSEQFLVLPWLKSGCSFEAVIGDPPDTEILGENVRISGGSMCTWEVGLEESYLRTYPSRLIVREPKLKLGSYTMRFRLTPSIHLSPFDSRGYAFDGTATVRYGERIEFKVADDFVVSFLYDYLWQQAEPKKTVTFPELVAEAHFKNGFREDDVDRYVSILDDFLLLVSLAEGQRCAVPQVDVVLPDKFFQIYRLDRSLPHVSDNHGFNEFLVDSGNLESFLAQAWERYRNSKHSDLIRSALAAITSDVDETMESKFLSLFSAVETLILVFRLENEHEYIVSDRKAWRKLTKEIQKVIRSSDGLANDESARRLMYGNLQGLNRIPLHVAFKKFLEGKRVGMDDLWPFSASDAGCSLTDIRNRLVHGYGLSDRFIDSFGIAIDHLEYYAKRLLLCSLGWDYKKSRVFMMRESHGSSLEDAISDMEKWKQG